jgi:hypothetical protein
MSDKAENGPNLTWFTVIPDIQLGYASTGHQNALTCFIFRFLKQPPLNLIHISIVPHHFYNPSGLPAINLCPMNSTPFDSEIFNAQRFSQRI